MKFSRVPEPIAVDVSSRRRWRFWLLLIGVPVGIAAVTLIGWVVSATSGLSAAAADADRLDPGWRLEEIEAKRSTPPDAENAALIIAQIKQTPLAGTPDWKLDELLTNYHPPRLLNDQQRDALGKMLALQAPRLPLARKLRDHPRGRHDIGWAANAFGTMLKCQENREAAAALRYHVFDRCQAGDLDAAMNDCIACFHAGSSLGDEPTTISMLVRIACQAVAVGLTERTLAQGEASPAMLAELQKRIEAEEPAQLLLIAARGERALSNHFFENFRNGKLGTNAVTGVAGLVGGMGGGSNLLDWIIYVPGFVTAQQSGLLRLMNRMVETSKLPPELWAAPFAQFRAEAPNLPVLAKLLFPAMDKIAEACRRNHAVLRCLIVALAMERHRREKGQWAESLADLVAAGYLKAVPADPTDGKPIRLKRLVDGWLIYATGMDGIDHGGKIERPKMYQAGFDIAIQLWDVAARRQPPLPPKPPEDEVTSPPVPREPPPPAGQTKPNGRPGMP